MEFGASSEDIARVCHAHPTLSEIVHEAALDIGGRAIHTAKRTALMVSSCPQLLEGREFVCHLENEMQIQRCWI